MAAAQTSPSDAHDGDLHSGAAWPPGHDLVVAATYNERHTLPVLIDRVLGLQPAIQMLVVDDDSPDGTGRLALDRARAEPRLHVLIRRGRRGLGGAIVEGLALARDHGFVNAVNMDADLSHDPRDIPRLLAALDDRGGLPVDIVVGSRRVPGGRIEGWPMARHAASRLVATFTRRILGVPVHDPSSGFRAMRLRSLDRLPPGIATGYAFFEEQLWHVHRCGGRLMELPITFTNREAGASKAGLSEAVAGALRLARLAWRTWLPSQPGPISRKQR